MRGFAQGGPQPRYEPFNIPGDGFVVLDHQANRTSREYPAMDDAESLAKWLNERWRGYPKRDLPWPHVTEDGRNVLWANRYGDSYYCFSDDCNECLKHRPD